MTRGAHHPRQQVRLGRGGRTISRAILRDEGAACDVVAARDAVDLEGYDLIVLGTGLYMGRPHRDARRFLHDHHAALAHQPFAVFALGPLSNEPEEKDKVRPQLERRSSTIPSSSPP